MICHRDLFCKDLTKKFKFVPNFFSLKLFYFVFTVISQSFYNQIFVKFFTGRAEINEFAIS